MCIEVIWWRPFRCTRGLSTSRKLFEAEVLVQQITPEQVDDQQPNVSASPWAALMWHLHLAPLIRTSHFHGMLMLPGHTLLAIKGHVHQPCQIKRTYKGGCWLRERWKLNCVMPVFFACRARHLHLRLLPSRLSITLLLPSRCRTTPRWMSHWTLSSCHTPKSQWPDTWSLSQFCRCTNVPFTAPCCH